MRLIYERAYFIGNAFSTAAYFRERLIRAKRTRPEGPSSRSEFSVFRDARFHKLKAEVY